MIELTNVSKTYRNGKESRTVINNTSLKLPDTGLICILGESGCGKTTLLNTIGGLDNFDQGSVNVDGVTFTNYNPHIIEPLRNEKFGYIFQNYYLLSDYTVEYNVMLSLNCYDMSEEEKKSRTDYVLSLLGIKRLKRKKVLNLSGGQQQRVAIARVLVKAPKIIFADEPTGNLDEENTIRTMTILKSISKKCLVLLVTHERNIADFFADRIIEIKDGTVINDSCRTEQSDFERTADSNIYLKEYSKTILAAENSVVNLYSNETMQNLELSLVVDNGKIYIKKSKDYEIITEEHNQSFTIVDDYKPKLKMSDIENFDYELSRPTGARNSRLPMKECYKMAIENLKLIVKKQFYFILALIIAAVLMTLTSIDYYDTRSISHEQIVSTDSHYVKLDFTNTRNFYSTDQLSIYAYIKNHLDTEEYGEAFFIPSIGLYLTDNTFVQTDSLRQMVKDFSYVDIKHLNENNLIYGRSPEKRNEVVVDRLVLEKLLNNKSVISNMYASVESFIGATMKTSIKTNPELIIVGISDTGEPNLYCNQNILLSYDIYGYSIASIDEFLNEYPVYESDIVIPTTNEILIRKGLFSSLSLNIYDKYYISSDKNYCFKVVGTIEDNLGIDYILSEEGCRQIRNIMFYQNKSAYLYCENPDETAVLINSNPKDSLRNFSVSATIPSKEQLSDYEESRTDYISAKNLIFGIIIILSWILLYFCIKSNILMRSEELTVYRLIGISKGSIRRMYLIEVILLTTCTSIPVIIITNLVISILNSIPSLEMNMNLSIWLSVGVMLFVYVFHSVISMLPVNNLLRQPPAALQKKF